MWVKLSFISFHNRLINLNLLKFFYFIKKEFLLSINKIFFIKNKIKLFNVLKSPVQYKVGRNQLGITKIKAVVLIKLFNVLLKKKFSKINLYRVLSNRFFIGVTKTISSNCFYKINKIFRV
jgi:hypothetical protein